jgi:hypothetical protein
MTLRPSFWFRWGSPLVVNGVECNKPRPAALTDEERATLRAGFTMCGMEAAGEFKESDDAE